VCRPCEFGGPGIIDHQRAGVALRVSWEWIRLVDANRVWRDLLGGIERAVVALFRAAIMSVVGSGEPTLITSRPLVEFR
jgi:hypothetical protein